MIVRYAPRRKILITIAKEKSARGDLIAVSRCKDSIEKTFLKKGIQPEVFFIKKSDFQNTSRLKEKISNINPFCVFNLFEGFSKDPGKEAVFVELLESAKIPFTGNGSFALFSCLDKMKAKSILEKNNLPVARGILVKKSKQRIMQNFTHEPARQRRTVKGSLKQSETSESKEATAARLASSAKRVGALSFTFPLFVKPCADDGSCGIHKDSLVHNKEELFSAIKKRRKYFPEGLIIEEFLPGKEYSVAFIGNNHYEVLGISEIDYSRCKGFLPGHKRGMKGRFEIAPFLTYEAKWKNKTLDYHLTMPDYKPKIRKNLRNKIISLARKAAKALGCRGYFRVDLREASGALFIIDVNPNPDINIDSGYIKLAYNKGYTYGAIIGKIVRLSNYH